MEAQEGDGQVEREGPHNLQRTLPQRYRQVVFFALMVDDMAAPEEVHFMTHPVCPVIRQVDKQKEAHPIPPRVWIQTKERRLLVDELVGAYGKHLQEKPGKLLGNSTADVCNGILKPIQLLFGEPFDQQLHADQGEENWDGKDYGVQVHGACGRFC